MDWKELGENIVKLGAPLLGTAIGGPAGGIVGGLIAQLFGADPTKPDDIMAKINSDPQAATKLQDLQQSIRKGWMNSSVSCRYPVRSRP